jgi:hypothetical protein
MGGMLVCDNCPFGTRLWTNFLLPVHFDLCAGFHEAPNTSQAVRKSCEAQSACCVSDAFEIAFGDIMTLKHARIFQTQLFVKMEYMPVHARD